jgi:hypothetical protein
MIHYTAEGGRRTTGQFEKTADPPAGGTAGIIYFIRINFSAHRFLLTGLLPLQFLLQLAYSFLVCIDLLPYLLKRPRNATDENDDTYSPVSRVRAPYDNGCGEQ